MSNSSEKGFTHLLAILVLGFGVGATVLSFIPVNRHYNDGKSDVAGVQIARGGEESGRSGSVNRGPSVSEAKPEVGQAVNRPRTEIVKVKTETEVKKMGQELRTEDETEVKVASDAGKTALVEKRVGALTKLPLSIDSKTNQMTVTTPAGTKVVTVLPQKAVDNMLASHVIDDVVSASSSGSLASIPDLVNLETKNGVLGYEVKGTKTHKLFGLIPIKTQVEAFVSAENGQVVDTTQSFLGRILNRIAP